MRLSEHVKVLAKLYHVSYHLLAVTLVLVFQRKVGAHYALVFIADGVRNDFILGLFCSGFVVLLAFVEKALLNHIDGCALVCG